MGALRRDAWRGPRRSENLVGPSMNPSVNLLGFQKGGHQLGRISWCPDPAASAMSGECREVLDDENHSTIGMSPDALGETHDGRKRRPPQGPPQEQLTQRLKHRLVLLADQILLEDLERDRAADHLGRMRGVRRLRRDGFSLIGLPPNASLSGLERLKALGLSELLLRAKEYEERRRPGSIELRYWWLARARIYKALMAL